MKRVLSITLIAGTISFSGCSSNQQSREKEIQDSIEAAAAADSMLRDATQSADTTVISDSIIVDTPAVKPNE